MACCGQRRASITTSETPVAAKHPPARSGMVMYEYTGPTAMTVAGPMSGTRYRFDSPGAKVEIDMRDAPFMGALPNLQRLV
jgi:hypothetical protein